MIRCAWLAGLLWAVSSPFLAFAVCDEVTAERYPDADAVVVDSTVKIEYAPDGTFVRRSEDKVKVLTEKGRREESEIVLYYNRRYGQATVTSVSIAAADGSVREIDVSATTKDTTDNSSTQANIYDPQDRRVVCTVPGLKVGEVITYRTEKRNFRSRVKDQFADVELLELTCPLKRARVEIVAPAERPLLKCAVRNELGNVKYERAQLADGRTAHVWTAVDSPQAFPEPDMPPFYTQAQLLRVSTAEDWPAISRWYWELCSGHLAKTTSAITNQVEVLGRDINKLYKWVSQEIRYMGLTMEDTSPGYAPHDVDITFENRYGVCRDKAALLVAMLRVAGFEAFPVLIHVGAKMDSEIPTPYFNHAIAAVRAPTDPRANADGYILMDPTDESSRDLLPAYLSDRSYLVACPEGEKLLTSQIPSAAENAVRIATRGTLERDGSMFFDSSIVFAGFNDNVYRGALLRRQRDDRRKLFERIVRAAAPGAELMSFELSPKNLQDTASPLTARLQVLAPEMLLRGETRDELSLPLLSRSLGAANWLLDGSTSLEKRRYPLCVNSTACVEEDFELKFAAAAPPRALALPARVDIDGDYQFDRSFEIDGDTLRARRRLAVNSVEISAADYAALRESVKRVEAAERERPVFARDRLENANVRGLDQREICGVSTRYNWIIVNTVVKQILTYDGKKNSSELKFNYNPTWKRIELVEASVSNLNGKVSRVTSREINTLDCEWASSAPRYPASKQLVVNLPAVEAGSVISYTLATIVTRSPLPFYRTWFFDSPYPVDRYELSVVHPFAHLPAIDYEGGKKRIKSEPMQPPAELWRDCRTLAAGDFVQAAERLRSAAAVAPAQSARLREILGADCDGLSAAEKILRIRNWMARNVRIAGPSLYEVPLEMQLTDSETVLSERYATRLDYIRTMCALLRRAGFAADVVFAAFDAQVDPKLRHRDIEEYPDVGRFSDALCRVVLREGGWLGIGGRRAVYFLGAENEYTPIEATAYAQCTYLDPGTGAIATIPEDPRYAAKVERSLVVRLRENGAADIDVTEKTFGPGVGAFRKMYAEMLPEERSRHFQAMLGELSEAASATRELVTDIEGYPATSSFSAFVPDYATIAGGAMTLAAPAIGFLPFNLTGLVRESPVGVGSAETERVSVKIIFPDSYCVIEHLPQEYSFADPASADRRWFDFRVAASVEGDGKAAHVEVELVRERSARDGSIVGADHAALLKEWSRLASSRANRTISARQNDGVKGRSLLIELSR